MTSTPELTGYQQIGPRKVINSLADWWRKLNLLETRGRGRQILACHHSATGPQVPHMVGWTDSWRNHRAVPTPVSVSRTGQSTRASAEPADHWQRRALCARPALSGSAAAGPAYAAHDTFVRTELVLPPPAWRAATAEPVQAKWIAWSPCNTNCQTRADAVKRMRQS